MAAPHRQRAASVAAMLAGGGVDLLQAASLLSQLGRTAGRAAPGEGAAPAREAFRFRGAPHFRFALSEVERVAWPATPDAPPVLHSAAFGLLGHDGPLPDWVTEELAQRVRRGDQAALFFMAIFEQRLFALLARSHARLRPGFGGQSGAESAAGPIAFALLGLGLPTLRNRLPVPDADLLPHVGLAVGRSRPALGLQAMLQRQLGVPVAIEPFHGRWLRIEDADRSRIGRGGQHQRLGQGALVGGRVWDVGSCFRIGIGPLTEAQHRALLPGGAAHRLLCALTRFHTTEETEFVISLTLRQDAVPVLRLATQAEAGSRLGWTSFLSGRRQQPAALRVRPRESR